MAGLAPPEAKTMSSEAVSEPENAGSIERLTARLADRIDTESLRLTPGETGDRNARPLMPSLPLNSPPQDRIVIRNRYVIPLEHPDNLPWVVLIHHGKLVDVFAFELRQSVVEVLI